MLACAGEPRGDINRTGPDCTTRSVDSSCSGARGRLPRVAFASTSTHKRTRVAREAQACHVRHAVRYAWSDSDLAYKGVEREGSTSVTRTCTHVAEKNGRSSRPKRTQQAGAWHGGSTLPPARPPAQRTLLWKEVEWSRELRGCAGSASGQGRLDAHADLCGVVRTMDTRARCGRSPGVSREVPAEGRPPLAKGGEIGR
jgi:hypothetical protein